MKTFGILPPLGRKGYHQRQGQQDHADHDNNYGDHRITAILAASDTIVATIEASAVPKSSRAAAITNRLCRFDVFILFSFLGIVCHPVKFWQERLFYFADHRPHLRTVYIVNAKVLPGQLGVQVPHNALKERTVDGGLVGHFCGFLCVACSRSSCRDQPLHFQSCAFLRSALRSQSRHTSPGLLTRFSQG
jgi:hypothetical protein